MEHLFFHCPLAASVLSWLHYLLFRSSPSFGPLLPRHVLFGFSSDDLLCVPRFFVYALNVCKFSIWVARNDFRFRDVRLGALPVLERVKSRLRFHLPLFFRRFKSSRRRRYFVRQWCANGFCWFSPRWLSVFIDLVFSFTFFRLVSFLFVFGCWLSALLPGPFPHQIARHQSGGESPGLVFYLCSFWFLPRFLTCPSVLFGVALSRHVSL